MSDKQFDETPAGMATAFAFLVLVVAAFVGGAVIYLGYAGYDVTDQYDRLEVTNDFGLMLAAIGVGLAAALVVDLLGAWIYGNSWILNFLVLALLLAIPFIVTGVLTLAISAAIFGVIWIFMPADSSDLARTVAVALSFVGGLCGYFWLRNRYPALKAFDPPSL